MRRALPRGDTPDHVALAYDAWSVVGDDGRVPEKDRSTWLSKLAGITVAADYARSFARWRAGFSAPGDRLVELALASRLLIGHGNASATDVGLTVHHTWGVPVVPGSAVKGLVAHYVDATYGPTDPDLEPWEQQGDERARADYQGVTWDHRRIERGPGAIYRALFGAPDAHDDDVMRAHGMDAGAAAGLVTFHDALYVPGSIVGDKPYIPDVLTVHQKGYYNSSGGSAPNDYDGPNPVAFLTVCPRTRLLFALSGPPDWTAFAETLLRRALEDGGVGGKTSAGYGRFESPEAQAAVTAPPRNLPVVRPGDRVEVVLLEARTKKGGWKGRSDEFGLEGPIQNSSDVPSEKMAGERILVEVRIAKGNESGFRYLGDSIGTKGTK